MSLNPQEHFPMQSVYKLPISMAVMKHVDAGKIKLSDKIPILKRDGRATWRTRRFASDTRTGLH